MIKRYLLISLLTVSSCSGINYSYFSDFRNALSRNEIIIDESFIDDQEYSFIKVSNAKNDAIFVLSSISPEGVYKWVGSKSEIIKTKGGLILETFGLQSDIKFYSSNFLVNQNTDRINTHINLYNPDLIFEPISFFKKSFQANTENGVTTEILVLERNVLNIGWTAEDIYSFKDGKIYQSTQEINPLLEPIKITFYFKY